MNTLGKAVLAPLKLLGIIPKAPRLPAPTPTVTRDDITQRIDLEDELRRRRGGAADIMTGARGAEPAAATGKATLGS